MNTVRAIQSLFGQGVHPLFLGITALGTSVALWSLLALYHWLIDPRFGRRLAVVFAASIIANHMLKEAFGTDRPYQIDPTLSTDTGRRTGEGHGFPSGHSMNISTFWFAMAFHYRKRLLWLAALVLVAAVGLSRLYLGVHLPIDVAGGFIFGALFAWVAGGWTGEPSLTLSPRLWIPLAGLAGLAAAFLGADPRPCGLLVGALIARPAFVPPRDAGGRVTIVAGGLAVLALLAGLLVWLPDRLLPGLGQSVPMAYLAYMVLSWVGFDVWPRIWGTFRPRTPDVRQ
jgi:membrane-associated phospholipid phosphatase